LWLTGEGTSRFKGLRIQRILELARDAVLFRLCPFRWRYLPRECNHTADFLAGVASQLLQTLRNEGASPEELANVAPLADVHGLTAPPGMGDQSDIWKAASLACHDPVASAVVLFERPDATQWQHLALLKQVDPQKGRALTQLYALAVRRSNHRGFGS
jgi:hypothetical protein